VKGEFFYAKHGFGMIVSFGQGLDLLQIPEHSIGFPLANEGDGSSVNFGDQKSGCTTRAEAVGGDLLRIDACKVLDIGCCLVECW
jgi:hypothetical protein